MEENRKALVDKLTTAIKSIGKFAADKRNTYQNYDYISADLVIERAGQALAEVGLVVLPTITLTEVVPQPTTGKVRYDAKIIFEMTLTDGDEKYVSSWIGFGTDTASPDKAIYKGITSGHKYYLMKLLQISIGNTDGEHDDAEEKPAQTPASTKKKNTKIEALGDEAVSIAKQYGGSKNAKVMEILAKYTDKGNPKSIKDEETLNALIADLKNPENVTLLMAGTPKQEEPAK